MAAKLYLFILFQNLKLKQKGVKTCKKHSKTRPEIQSKEMNEKLRTTVPDQISLIPPFITRYYAVTYHQILKTLGCFSAPGFYQNIAKIGDIKM